MDALIELTLRALGAVFLNRFGLGLLLVLLALYGVGSGWPLALNVLLGCGGAVVWGASLHRALLTWRDCRSSRPNSKGGPA